MKAKSVLFLLICSACAGAQAVQSGQPLQPFRINKLVVTGLRDLSDVQVKISGQTLDDQEVPLFSTPEGVSTNQLDCYLYLDDSIRSVRVEISSSMILQPARFEYPTLLNPYQLTVHAEPRWMAAQPAGYRFASKLEQLHPGDILVLSATESSGLPDIEDLRDRGIHVIANRAIPGLDRREAGRERWRGEATVLDFSNPADLAEVLESRRDDFAVFRKRFYDLTAEANFYGVPTTPGNGLIFPKARVEDIATALERLYLPSRITGFHRAILLGFSLAAVLLVLLVRRTPALVLWLAALLCIFGLLAIPNPDPAKSLYLSLNLSDLDSESFELVRTAARENDRARPSVRDFTPGIETQRFAPPEYKQEEWTLQYGFLRSVDRQTSLSRFTTAVSVKFDQIPLIAWRSGRYALTYENPLRYWSLYEPE